MEIKPEKRLKIYEKAKEIVRSSVCYALERAIMVLHPELGYYETFTELFSNALPEFEKERKRRHQSYGNYWWSPVNIKIRQEFIQKYLIDEVKKEIERGSKW